MSRLRSCVETLTCRPGLQGLAGFIASAAAAAGVASGAGVEASPALRGELRARLTSRDPMEWLRPPMLSPRA